MEAPELEHLGVDLGDAPLGVGRVELLDVAVYIVGEGVKRAVGRDEIRRLVREVEELREGRAGSRLPERSNGRPAPQHRWG